MMMKNTFSEEREAEEEWFLESGSSLRVPLPVKEGKEAIEERKYTAKKEGDSWFLNLEELGCEPARKVLVPGNTGACFEQATELAKLHNAALSKALQELETKLVEFNYAKHDINISFSERRNNPEKYGFKEADIACCGSGPYRGIDGCGGKRGVTDYELCSDPTEYLYFDSSHPSDKANKQISELMWSGAPNLTGPYNLKALFEA
ncbi:hypothetical protein PTKIN_Ptkin18bG0083200 [Pterospermum kingtungense]